MAEKYREICVKDPSRKFVGLGPAMLSYVVAAENAVAIANLFNDQANPTKIAMLKNKEQCITFARAIKDKIDSDLANNDYKTVFLSKFDPVERLIIDKSANINNRVIDFFTSSLGITK